ncbi:MAG: hypothetical protein SOX77_03760 [Candidatus Borkfalkiaceae bacterium]|nr:hypothetical protein [Christensenellaceae bacterium]
MKDGITVFSINITIKIPLRFFAFCHPVVAQLTDYDEGVRRFTQWNEFVESLEIPKFEDRTKAYRRWFWGITE